MSKLQIQGSWEQVKSKLKRRFGRLNDQDLQYTEGEEDQLFNRLQRRLGKSREEVIQIIQRVR